MYILGKGISQAVPMMVVSLVFLGVLFAQYRWYSKKLDTLEHENRRIGDEKSKLQEKLALRDFQHVADNQPSQD